MAGTMRETRKAIVELMKADRVTRAEAEDRAREIREHMAQVMDEMHDQGWKDCDELQATWDVLNACEIEVYRAARELPDDYDEDDRKETRRTGARMLTEDRATRAEANDTADEMRERMKQLTEDRRNMGWTDCDELNAAWDTLNTNASMLHAAAWLLPDAYDEEDPNLRQIRMQQISTEFADADEYMDRLYEAADEAEARDWLEEWFDGAEDPEAPVVRKDEDEDEAPWDVARREREAKAAEDAARRAGKDHLMIIDDSNMYEGPAIEYRAVKDFWNGSDEMLQNLSRDGYVLVTLISRDMIEEEAFGDAGENGRLDVWFRPSRQAYVPRAEYDREVERLRAEADVARAAGAKAGWEAAESAYRNSLDYFELMKRSWKDRDDSPYPPEA